MNRRVVAVVPVLVAVGTAVWVLRLAARHAAPEDTPSVLAYRVPAGEAVVFPLAPEDRDPALMAYLELPEDEDGAPRTFALSLVARDEADREVWRGRAVLEALPGPDRAEPAPSLLGRGGRAVALTESRQLRVPTPPGARWLVVGLERAHDGQRSAALMRLVRRAPRHTLWSAFPPRVDATARRLGDRLHPFGWPYVDGQTLSALTVDPTRRRAAVAGASGVPPLVRVLFGPVEPPPRRARPPTGEWLGPGDGVAWTVRGPGGVRLRLVAPFRVAARVVTVDHRGATTAHTVPVDASGVEVELDAPADGALTVEVLCDEAPGLRARAFAERGAVQLGTRGADGELRPDRRRTTLWRLRPDAPPVRATLADGLVRLALRPVDASPASPRAPRFRWRILRADGQVASQGVDVVPADRARFERWRPPWEEQARALVDEAVPGEPVVYVAGGEPGDVLELAALDAPLAVSFEAADDPDAPEPDPGYALPLDGARLRFAPWRRRLWVAFRPEQHAALVEEGDALELEGQVRLEPTGPDAGGGPYRSITPYPPRTRHLLVEPTSDPSRWRAFHRTAFATNELIRLQVPASGERAGRLVLDVRLGREALGATLRVRVDGEVALTRRVTFPRGRLRLRGLRPGAREVLVEGPPGLVVTGTPAADPATAHAERVVWRLDRGGGSLVVPVWLGHGEARTLHAVVYGDEPATGAWRVRAVVDDGRRGPVLHRTGGRTRLERTIESPVRPASAVWLDREGEARAAATFAVRLGPDLGPGLHRVRLTLLGGPARAHARFFVTGAPRDVRRAAATVEWEVD